MSPEHEHVPPAGGLVAAGRFVGRMKTTVFVGKLMIAKVSIGVMGEVSIAVGGVMGG